MFTLNANQELTIGGVPWHVVQHPGALGMAYGQEGRAAVVYQLCRGSHRFQGPVSILGSDGRAHEVPGDGSSLTFGRAPGNGLVLSAVAVSRQHGALVVKDGQLMVWDNSARNGTFIDGHKVEPQKWVPVPAGSRLQLGTAEDGEPLAVRPDASACRALKVFKSRFRVPRLVELSTKLASFADIPGLQVCTRTVFTPQDHRTLLVSQPELVYGVLMPWIEGRSWMEMILERQALTTEESLTCATSLVKILVEMEQRGIAHCDLSGPNVSLERTEERLGIQLVDVEQIYSTILPRPEEVFAGSPGYAHRHLDSLAWSPVSDRFSGAILICELLAWSSGDMRDVAWSESFFEPNEMQTECARADQLRAYLERQWGSKLSRLFERAWRSDSLEHCPTFGEWELALPQAAPRSDAKAVNLSPGPGPAVSTPVGPVPTAALAQVAPAVAAPVAAAPARPAAETVAANEGSEDGAAALMDRARQLEEAGNLQGALTHYQLASSLAPIGTALAKELALIVSEISSRVSTTASPKSDPPPPPAPPVTLGEAAPTKKGVDAELLQRVRALEGAPGLAAPDKRSKQVAPNKAQWFGYGLISVMLMLLAAFLIRYQPWNRP